MSNRFYGSANDETKLVTRLYGGSSNGAVRISKLYGPVNQTLLTFTNPTNVSVSKKIFLDKTTDAGMTDFNGRIEMLRPSSFPTLISTLTIRPDTGSIISLKESGYITSAKAVALLSEWGIYTTTSYLDSLSQTNVYYTLSSFTSTTGFGTKLIHQGFGHVKYVVPEHFSITPDGTIVTAIDGETLCALAKSQYPNKYTQTVSATFRYRNGIYYISGQTSNSEDTFYKSGGVSAMTNAGVTFATGLSGDVSTTLPVTYIPETN